jgi:hypothetical protein
VLLGIGVVAPKGRRSSAERRARDRVRLAPIWCLQPALCCVVVLPPDAAVECLLAGSSWRRGGVSRQEASKGVASDLAPLAQVR